MRVHHWTSEHPNFGDDINLFLWQFLMPEVVARDDGALLIGVGTVLSDQLPMGTPRVVLGSGVGYKPPPRSLSSPNWRVYSVRGPLTARLVGLPVDAAIIDPAALLPFLPDWNRSGTLDTILVPHWETAHLSVWRSAAQAAEIRFVDPRQDAHIVIEQIASAKLVIAESMHAAIVADAFRVPWVAIVGSHRSSFKWMDWAASLDLIYKPLLIGPLAAALSALAPEREYPFSEGNRSSKHDRNERWIRRIVRTIPANIQTAMLTRALSDAKTREPSLSDATKLVLRQQQLRDRIEQLRDDYASGRIMSGLEACA